MTPGGAPEPSEGAPIAEAPREGALGDPEPDEDLPARRPGDGITDYRAVAFLMVLFLLALGLMYLIGRGR